MEGEGVWYSAGNDMISELPQCILGIILSKMPIIDAIRTSLLSTSWRYKWLALTDLVFDDKSFDAMTTEKVDDFITKTLFLHNGLIHKFSLSSWELSSSPNIDQWLLFVSRKDVRELVVEIGESEKLCYLPSCIFSCKNLTKLVLSGCAFDARSNLNGFPCLKDLELEVSWNGKEEIEWLISTSPLLESFKLMYFHSDSVELALHAQNLQRLYLEGDISNISLVCTPRLVNVFVDVSTVEDETFASLQYHPKGDFYTFFESIPKLERLAWRGYFVWFLGIHDNSPRLSSEAINEHLKFIQIDDIDFGCSKEVRILIHMIRNSPNLQHLVVSCYGDFATQGSAIQEQEPFVESLYDNFPAFSTLSKLKTVELIDVSGRPYEGYLIKLVLAHSPNLEVVKISPERRFIKDKRYGFFIDLLSYGRVSAKASIIFAEPAY